MTMRTLLCGLAALGLAASALAETVSKQWWLWPDYALGQRARNDLRPTSDRIDATAPVVATERAPLRLFGQRQSAPATILLEQGAPVASFTAELWLLDHVNHPIGAALSARPDHGEPAWTLGVFGRRAALSLGAQTIAADLPREGFKQRFFHVAASSDGVMARVYLNGQLAAEQPIAAPPTATPAALQLAPFLELEPHMQSADFVKHVRIADAPAPADAIAARFADLCALVERGALHPTEPHFTAPPTITFVSRDSAGLVLETDRPTRLRVAYGRAEPLDRSLEIPALATLHKVNLAGLETRTSYFYRVTATAEDGSVIDSGMLSLRTAVDEGQPFTFAVIGDTESRPHINHRLARLIWDGRPDFLVNVGDLTDGGMAPNKYEWTYEYFVGMGALIGRLPSFTVPGNGEGDLHWYLRYHNQPQESGFYSFRYGDAEFFMLDSNRRESDFAPGGRQHEWLRARLAASTARWKFVALHHPFYTSDEDDYGDTWKGDSKFGDDRVRQILPVIEAGGVDAVFFGHLHSYERTRRVREGRLDDAGVLYVQAGGAGGHLEDFAPARTWFSSITHRGHHYLTVAIDGDRMELRMHDIDGDLRDVHVHEKRGRPAVASGD